MVSIFGLVGFSFCKIEGARQNVIKSQDARQDYDIINIPFADLETQEPKGRQTKIRGIVLHASEIPSVFTTISVLQKRSVGCHYIIPQKTLLQLKQEAKKLLAQQKSLPESEKLSDVALNACRVIMAFQGKKNSIPVLQLALDDMCVYHAGKGDWKDWLAPGLRVKHSTIGIECANSTTYKTGTHDLFRYSGMQMQVLSALLHHLLANHKLSATDVVTHSDISWDRPDDVYKKDPGPYFPYETLARNGLGVVPLAKDFPPLPKDRRNQKDMISWIQNCFQIIGYRPCPVTGVWTINTAKILRAYALHFFPECPKYTSKGYDFEPLVGSLLHHPWAQYVLTKEENCELSTGIEQINLDQFI